MKTIPFYLRTAAVASLLLWSTPAARSANVSLVPTGAVWKYLDTGSNQGTAWAAPGFDDSAWASGPAQLGYGDGDEATVISFGPDANNKFVTTYFRRAFNVSDASGFTSLSLGVLRDDGVVVYLNGTEVHRDNMPSGAVTYTTLASAAIGGAGESTFYVASINPALLVEGVNVLAVEVHQATANSSDISFNLELTGQLPLMQITLNGPAHGATGVSLSPTLDVSVLHRNGLPMTVTFHGRVAPPVGPDFTLVALPDTQFYSSSLNGGTPQIFISQTEWIIGNLQARNIVFTTQLGDCVQNGDNGGNDVEWRNATNALYRLEDPLRTLLTYGLPYGVAVGNHDQSPIGSATGTTTFYNQYFGEAHFAGRPYYGGHYGSNNDEHFELFSASGIDFIIIHFEYDSAMTTNSLELDWASQLLQTYSSRQAIVVSHWIMNSGENGSFSAQGQAIYNRLKVYPNLFLMLCGHVNPNGEGRRTDVYNGNTVYTVLSDYQDRPNGGNGWLRLMEFSPANSVIRVSTYSPTLNQFETDANSQFDLYYDMQSQVGDPFGTIAVNSGVPLGGSTTAAWPDRALSTDYEWFVSVSDGVETVTSPGWRFRTVDQSLPSAPTALSATAQSSAEILLAWTDNANNEAGFEIHQSLDGVSFSLIGTVGADGTSATVGGLQPNTTYYYLVRAFNGAGASPNSNVAAATTLPLPPPPASPTDLNAAAASQSQVNLTWTDNADSETSFRIERSTDGASFTEVGSVAANLTVYSDTGLSAFTLYYYRLRASNSGGDSDYSNVASVTTQPPPPPPAPTGLSAVGGDRIVTLSWNESPGASHYYAYRSEIPGEGYNLVAYGIFDTTWIDASVTPHTTYYYVVKAVGDGGPSPYSTEASAAPYALPFAPTGATITFADVNALELSWTDNATDETGYRVERSLDNTNFALVAILPADTWVYWDDGLADNTTYYYRVRAFNNDGESVSAEASGTTLALPANPPSNLAALGVSNSQIDLAWTDNAANEDGFKIERSTSGGPFAEIAVLGANVTAYSDGGLTPATAYAYRVRAFNSAGDSDYAEASASTFPLSPAAPGGLVAAAVSTSQIDLTWTDNANNETAFELERKIGSAGAWSLLATLAANTVSHSDAGLTPNTTYYYRVRALNAGGFSVYSSEASATTPAPTTVTLVSSAVQDGYVTESAESSSVGGSATANSTTTSGLRAGDDNKDRQIRAVVSFDTSSIPDGATILSATLRLRRGTVSGTNPFQTHGNCHVDIKSGSGFNNSAALTKEDFQAPADAAQVATLSNAAANGLWSEGALNSTGLSFINKTGVTQCRIYFQLDDNDDTGNDYIGWYAGDNATAANRPQLVVVYQ